MKETLFRRPSAAPAAPQLANELRRLTRARLQGVALAAAVLGVVDLLVWGLMPGMLDHAQHDVTMFAFVAIAASVVVGVLARRIESDRRILDLTLAYYVLGAAAIATFWASFPWPTGLTRPLLSPTAAWVAFFPMVVPNTQPRMVVGAVLGASMDLVVLATGSEPWPPTDELVLVHYANLAAVVVAILASRTLYRLGREIERVREMGAYRLLERLGKGGMGEVWRAEHQLLARPAAVKLIRVEELGHDRSVARRFEREAQATATLHSPHTIKLYDFGIAEDGTFYYVMELLDGMDLESLVRVDGPQPPERVCFLLLQICHSLAEAHADGFVHRDIKPANIFVCRHGIDDDFIKILDFGLVTRPRGGGSVDSGVVTKEDVIHGTPATMSPEMILGDDVDARADLYAVGCVAYTLLTGRMVFDDDTLMKVLMHHVHDPPEPPSAFVELPEALDTLVMRLLAKEPESRFQTANELREAIEALRLAHAWTPERRRHWWEQRPALPAPEEVDATAGTERIA